MRALILLLPLALLVAACSNPITVNTDFDPAADFASYKSYAWASPKDPNSIQSLSDKRIKAAVETQLESHGFTKAASQADADVIMGYHTNLKDKIQVYDSGYGYGYGYGWGGRSVDVSSYTQGTLIVDMIDPVKKTIVWEGVASAAVDPNKSDEGQLNSAVKQMFWDYPPKK